MDLSKSLKRRLMKNNLALDITQSSDFENYLNFSAEEYVRRQKEQERNKRAMNNYNSKKVISQGDIDPEVTSPRVKEVEFPSKNDEWSKISKTIY